MALVKVLSQGPLKALRLRAAYPAFSNTASLQEQSASSGPGNVFDEQLLEYIVCPLSKASLRWDASASELICDELGVAYPVVDGMPNLRPADGRIIETAEPEHAEEKAATQQPWGKTDASA